MRGEGEGEHTCTTKGCGTVTAELTYLVAMCERAALSALNHVIDYDLAVVLAIVRREHRVSLCAFLNEWLRAPPPEAYLEGRRSTLRNLRRARRELCCPHDASFEL